MESQLIRVKNPKLYQEWLYYYSWHDSDLPGYVQRTQAFFNSEKGLVPPF